MSAYELISLIVWTISAVAVVYSLYQVNRQTRILARQTEYLARAQLESSIESLSNQSRDVTRIFLTYPELRPYFYEGQDIDEKNPHFHRAETVAELILDIFWTMHSQAARVDFSGMNDDLHNGEGLWDDFVQDSFALSPILCKTLNKRQGWYGPEMVDQMNAVLKQQEVRA
jgi:hypothetical protein